MSNHRRIIQTYLFVTTSSGAKVKEGSLHVSHSNVTPLINELDYLRKNHSDVIKAEEEAKNELDRALKNHTQLKEKIEQQKTINDNYQKQIEELQTEKTNLKSNVSALGQLYYSFYLINNTYLKAPER